MRVSNKLEFSKWLLSIGIGNNVNKVVPSQVIINVDLGADL